MRKIRKGDNVVVITGKDKGKRGSGAAGAERQPRAGGRRQQCQEAPEAQSDEGHHRRHRRDKEMPIHVSNVALFNPTTQKADRVGVKRLEDGRRVRIYKSNGEMLDA